MVGKLGTFIGSFIVGIAIFSAWSPMVELWGPAGGWLAALFIVTPTWFMNHWVGLFEQKGAWVDQGIAIGATGIAKGFFLDGFSSFPQSLTLILMVAIGGAVGGIIAQQLEQFKEEEKLEQFKEKEKLEQFKEEQSA